MTERKYGQGLKWDDDGKGEEMKKVSEKVENSRDGGKEAPLSIIHCKVATTNFLLVYIIVVSLLQGQFSPSRRDTVTIRYVQQCQPVQSSRNSYLPRANYLKARIRRLGRGKHVENN